ncbi:ABC-type Fe3+-siderophore transport system, permease component [Deinococcus geothermalis DSM 11300]|uniref:ABC-type Fe3+-siderophore transport system, permease component n=1 Tax=Deinococcus geothermalis (strain DSM 11300 / CIP 105573 / AG-3a) TaxID=319795 RepID=Q1J2F6_DEIGD|nr:MULTISPECIES: iron ABC transporter permease [Deinococcus]ABF44328.1 ABC-type Fe3+-siderophore transport system, permease component [Deinococcus geothermalis DSM 11300]MBI0445181.1 iron ABC transporter permease [Deinococcus sp. DB0503]TDE86515.1 iron ABC transporter permease [Deinococcus sp. S9]
MNLEPERQALGWPGPRRLGRTAALVVLLLAVIVLAVGLGSVTIAPGEVLGALWHGVSGAALSGNDVIVWQIRLPRVLMGVVVGACLAVCGGAFQGVFRNPLADPYLLGVASGAGLGATIGIVAGWPRGSIPLAALLMALAAVTVTLTLAREGRRFPPTRLILAGVVVGSVLSACSTFLILRGEDRARQVLAYTLGDLGFSGWRDVGTVLPYAAVGCGVLILLGRALDTLQLGDLTARSLGVPVERLRLLVVIAASIATAAAVAYVGIIGFVGLIVPHVVRLAWGTNHRVLLPISALLGGALLVLADLLARTTLLSQVGVVTTLLGGPFFLWLLRREGHD